jgi:catechol 2,3-dioxygenase-like lactoylglutathione lyase family enzyme
MAVSSFEVILYVADQVQSRVFYRAVLALEPVLDVPGMTEFAVGGATLGLMPERGIKKLLGDAIADPNDAAGIARCELYLRVDNPTEYATRALAAGAQELSPIQLRDWGDEVVYLADPDSHVIAFARKR